MLVQYGYMWRGRQVATLLPAFERARRSLTRAGALPPPPLPERF